MKPLLSFLLTLALLCSFASTPTTTEITAADTTYVYICTGSSSTKYHKTASCRGLNNCKGKIIKVSRTVAEEEYPPPAKFANRKVQTCFAADQAIALICTLGRYQ